MDINVIRHIALWAIPVLFAITFHEVAHGWVAYKLGDRTAKFLGRLSLNPFKHVDLIGTVIVPIVLFVTSGFIIGWAKPVPVDARNFKNPKRDMAIVAASGPLANIIMALLWGVIAKLTTLLQPGTAHFTAIMIYMAQAGIMVNLILAIINLIPIPPLDGGRILSGILPRRLSGQLNLIEPYGLWIVVLLLVTGILSKIILPILDSLLSFINTLLHIG